MKIWMKLFQECLEPLICNVYSHYTDKPYFVNYVDIILQMKMFG